MATNFGTAGNDSWTVAQPSTFVLDGRGGTDTLSLGISLRSDYTITRSASGAVHVDSVSGASGGGLHATLHNIEFLTFNNGTDRIELATYFDDTPVRTLTGTDFDDRFAPGSGPTMVDGRGGIDTVTLPGPRDGWALSSGADGLQLTRADSSVTLREVERLQFADQHLALDLSGNAGLVAKVLGAVFGAASVRDPVYVGIGLQLADGGLDAQALMRLALDARLGAGASHADVVRLLYGNVVGQPPSDEVLAAYVALLDGGTHSAASLGVLAAETTLNAQNIDLVGLAATGLVFTP